MDQPPTKLTCLPNIYGIARKAGMINVRVLNSEGKSDVSTVIAGIQWS